ncbi:MAG: 3-hydroxyacyl-CoA dehydrogenase [Betaproteobacteria bacterium HGW-Betaproteobacteria-13]|jgi:NAD(P)-dependent dehydrogenase (short-subunit alcohol dehydrogenase family)|uniref:3-hydroxyacyl-CoA dehydrogenase n=1 Tax=Parazoarcus communis TaxID=41977 RepID=A0A2U8H444_9RHOO|nr:SDR family NAD(P)-dependent oxidoreductase [Parazoarcus communis]AWI80839.1 3-hydroxyacyl-CoA dehydrogenase [Parazoarcus communis]PKO57671.1 MAG: 3-hydroxyacyl-CoA dehydrogenase [Betaproteobacteria bacterium HGW-Betaproteobacteria-19]PKO79944.1 MAG: 3-hydroxyacyl-CoA dehydrogenase [Betaproteobacteria bacterium HGW-Betaproteobacteria-13]
MSSTFETSSSSTLPLSGRHAVVTGAGSGIGEAIAQELARLGATLTLVGRRAEPLESARATLAGQGHGVVVADITDHAGIAQAFAGAAAERGPIAILVNNAGAAKSAPAGKTTPALWNEMLTVNLTGTFNCTQAVLAGMQAARWGRIVNIASTAGLVGYAYVSAYSAAKHGVIGFTRSLALEVAKQGITVNAVCPGYTDTPLLGGAVDNIVAKTGRSSDEAKTTLAASNPQGRLVQPEDVARTVGWLCQPGSEAIHGQSIPVAGGEVMAG